MNPTRKPRPPGSATGRPRRGGYEEQAASIRAARAALTRVLESENATPEEILEAARLLVEMGK